MFDIPKYGWVHVTIGTFDAPASYTTSVPKDALTACIRALEDNVPLVIRFDAEGWEYIVVSDYYTTYVIIEDEYGDIKAITQDIKQHTIIKEIYDDILTNIDKWVEWEPGYDNNNTDDLMTLILLSEKLRYLMEE